MIIKLTKNNSVKLKVEFNKAGILKCQNEYWLSENLITVNSDLAYIDMLINPQEFEYMKSLFLSFGSSAIVQSPVKLKNMIENEIKEMLKQMEDY